MGDLDSQQQPPPAKGRGRAYARPHPLASIRLLREKAPDGVIVAFSRGKDSLVALDLCCQHWPAGRVAAFFCWMVPGLAFEEQHLRYTERRYGISIHRLPHWFLPNWIRTGRYRPVTAAAQRCPKLTEQDIMDEMRQRTGLDWIVTGRKADDSIWRRSIVHHTPSGLFEKRREAWPLAWWTNPGVWNYLKANRIPLPPDYGRLRQTVGALDAAELALIRDRYPADYAKIIHCFPLIESQLAREQFRRERWRRDGTGSDAGGCEAEPLPEVHGTAGASLGTEERPV